MALFKKKTGDNIEEFRDIEDDVSERDFIPYACHWNAETIITKNGEMLQIIRVADDSPKQSEMGEIDLRSKVREALEVIDTADYAVWIHTVRSKASYQTQGEYKRDFAGYLDRFWKDRNDWEHKFINEVFITIVREGQDANLMNAQGFVRQILPNVDIRYRENYIDEGTQKLTLIADKMVKILSPFGAKKLGCYFENDTWFTEPVSFFGKLTSLQNRQMPVEQKGLYDQLTDYDVTFGYNALEIRTKNEGKRRFAAYMSVKEYRELPLDPLDTLLKMPLEFIISQCFIFTGKGNALKGYDYQKKLFEMSNSSQLAVRSGLQGILESDKNGVTDFCEYQLGILLLADSVKTLDGNVSKTVNTLGVLGLTTMREDIMLEECYWAMMPGNFQMMKRLRPLNTSAMGGFANLSFLPSGTPKNNHWGPAVTTFFTVARTPYYFNFHEGDNGHTVLLGPPNAGKKVLMNFLLAQSRKYDGKLFYFDRGRLGETFIRSVDGLYFNPLPETDSRAYVQMAMNPLQLDDTQPNRDFLERWLMMIAGPAGNAQLAATVKAVVPLLLQKPKAERVLQACADMLAEQDASWKDIMAPWLAGGKYATIFNHPADTLTLDGKVYGFEMGNLLQNPPTLMPVFAYLLHRVMQALDGKPSMVVMDEAWDLLETPMLAPRLKGWLQALREKNAMALLASENIDNVKNSPINSVLFPEIATKIFLPDDSADASYVDIFDLPIKDVALLTAMNTEDRNFLVTRKNESVVLELDLSGMVDIVSVLAATPYHLQMMEQAIVARGISPSQWMPKFLETI